MSDACLINPKREKGEPQIAGPVLLCINPHDAGSVCQRAESSGGRRYFIYNSNLWQATADQQGFFICGPMVGAPMAVLCLEKLIALGARDFIVFGSCGSLDPELSIGEIFLPTEGVSEEGTSVHYPLAGQPQADTVLCGALTSFLQGVGLVPVSGTLWTTDAPYRETREKVCRMQARGVKAVDMEFSAMLSVAAYRGVSLAAVMVVSDQLAGDCWQSGFQDSRFKQRSRQLRSALFDFCLQER